MSASILSQEIPCVSTWEITDGIYYGQISKVFLTKDETKIVVAVKVENKDGKQQTVYIRTPIVAEYSYSMINRICESCNTKVPNEFVGKEVWVSIVVNAIDSVRKYTNVVDIIEYDESIADDLTVSEKGYFEFY